MDDEQFLAAFEKPAAPAKPQASSPLAQDDFFRQDTTLEQQSEAAAPAPAPIAPAAPQAPQAAGDADDEAFLQAVEDPDFQASALAGNRFNDLYEMREIAAKQALPDFDSRVTDELNKDEVSTRFSNVRTDLNQFSAGHDELVGKAGRSAQMVAAAGPGAIPAPNPDVERSRETLEMKQRSMDRITGERSKKEQEIRKRLEAEAAEKNPQLKIISRAIELREQADEEEAQTIHKDKKRDPIAEYGAQLHQVKQALENKQINENQAQNLISNITRKAKRAVDLRNGRSGGEKTMDILKKSPEIIKGTAKGIKDFAVGLAKTPWRAIVQTGAGISGAAGSTEGAQESATRSAENVIAGQSLENNYGGIMDRWRSFFSETPDEESLDFYAQLTKAANDASLAEGRPLKEGGFAAISETIGGENPHTAFSPEALKGIGARPVDQEEIAQISAAADPVNLAMGKIPNLPGAAKLGGGMTALTGKILETGAKYGSKGARAGARRMAGGLIGGLSSLGADAVGKGLEVVGKLGTSMKGAGKAQMKGAPTKLATEVAEKQLAGESVGVLKRGALKAQSLAPHVLAAPVTTAPLNAAMNPDVFRGDAEGFVAATVGAPAWVGVLGFGGTNRGEILGATSHILREKGQKSFDGRTDEMANITRETLKQMNPEARNSVTEITAAFEGMPVKSSDGKKTSITRVDVMPADQFAKKFGEENAAGVFISDDGTVTLNAGAKSNQTGQGVNANMGHELGGHAVQNFMRSMSNKGGAIYEGLMEKVRESGLVDKDGKPSEDLKDFVDRYNKKLAPENQIKAEDPIALEEWLSEQAASVFANHGAADLALPRTVAEKIEQSVGKFINGALGRKPPTRFGRKEIGALTDAYTDILRGITDTTLRDEEGFVVEDIPEDLPPGISDADGNPIPKAEGEPKPEPIPEKTVEQLRERWIYGGGSIKPKSVTTLRAEENSRSREFDQALNEYKDYLEENDLQAPEHPNDLEQELIEFSLGKMPGQPAVKPKTSEAPGKGVLARSEPVESEAPAGGVLSRTPKAEPVESAESAEPAGVLARESKPAEAEKPVEKERYMEPDEIKARGQIESRLKKAEEAAKADTRYANRRLKDSGRKKIVKEHQDKVMAAVLEEAAGDDQGLLRERFETDDAGEPVLDKEGNRVSKGLAGRIDLSIPAHKVFLERNGVTDKSHQKLIQDFTGGKVVYVDHISAKNERPDDISAAQRRAEYLKNPAKMRNKENSTDQFNKAIFGLGVKPTKDGHALVYGWSIDKLIGNISKLMDHAKAKGWDIGYKDINDPQIIADLNQYFANHMENKTGDGSRTIEGKKLKGSEGKIARNRFDLLNAAFHMGQASPEARKMAEQAGWIKKGDKGDVNKFRELVDADGTFKVGKGEGTEGVLEPILETMRAENVLGVRDQPDGEADIVRNVGFKGDATQIKGIPKSEFIKRGYVPDEPMGDGGILSRKEKFAKVKSGEQVDGLIVRDEVPNMESAKNWYNSQKILPGVRKIPISDEIFSGYTRQGHPESLAKEIEASGEIAPLIIGIPRDGNPEIIEGANRIAALEQMGKKEFPAIVVEESEAKYTVSSGYNGSYRVHPEGRSNKEDVASYHDSAEAAWEAADKLNGDFVPDEEMGSSNETKKGILGRHEEPVTRDNVLVSLSANTSSIPGIKKLRDQAIAGDKSANLLLGDIAHDALKYLTGGIPSAEIKFDRTTGLYGGEYEPSLGIKMSFDKADRESSLAALSKFAQNFNQEQFHVRDTPEKSTELGHDYGDGSFNTIAYRFELAKPISHAEIEKIAQAAGLAGMTAADNYIEIYNVNRPDNENSIQQFIQSAEKARELLGDRVRSVGKEVQRFWAYGEGEGATPYGKVAGELRSGSAKENITARRVAERLAGREVIPIAQEKELTPKQQKIHEQISKDFEALKLDNMKDPRVRRAYEELGEELKSQFESLPIRVEMYGEKSEPYKTSKEMRKDVIENNHLYIYGTNADTFGPAGIDYKDHPLLQPTEFKDVNGKTLLANDLLRAVHDYYAHTMAHAQFGPLGEEAAWRNHMAMTKSPWARWALTTETRGQNSWVNFGPKGEHNRKNPHDTVFAEQKTDLLPIEWAKTGDENLDAEMDSIASSDGTKKEPLQLKEGETLKASKSFLKNFVPDEKINIDDYADRRVISLTSDRLHTGEVATGPKGAKKILERPAQGGRGFMNIFNGGGWAFSSEGTAKSFLSRAKSVADEDGKALVAVTVLNPINHMNSPFGQLAYVNALRAAVESGHIKEKIADKHVKEVMKRVATNPILKGNDSLDAIKQIKSLHEFEKAIRDKKINFGAAGQINKKAQGKTLPILAKHAEEMGIDFASIARDIADPELADVPFGSVVALMEVDTKKAPTKDDFHYSYPVSVHGKRIGFLKEFPNVGDLTSDPRIYDGKGKVSAQPLMTVMPELDRIKERSGERIASEPEKRKGVLAK